MPRRASGEGSISHRKDGRWVAVLSVPTGSGRKRHCLYASTQQEALAKLTRVRQALDQGIAPADGRLTVGELLRRWLDDTILPNRRPATYQGYRVNVERHLIPRLGRVRLVHLQPPDIRKLQNDLLAQGLSPRTVQYVRTNLRSAIQQAVADGLVARNVVDLVSAPSAERAEIHPLTPEQVAAFLESVHGDRLEALYVTAFTTGLRQSELLGLRWSDLDLDGQTLTVAKSLQRGRGVVLSEPKSRKSRRTLALADITVSALRANRLRQLEEKLAAGPDWHDHSLVFSTKVGTPIDHRNLTRYFQRQIAAAGLPHQRFHDARHACATFLLAQGVALKVIQEILGHASIQLTADTYAHVLPQLQRAAMGSFDRILRPESAAS